MTTTTAPSHGFRPGSARAALSYPAFRALFIGSSLSNVGTWMQNFTLPAYIDDRTGSATLVGLLVFTQLGPLLVLSIPAGVIADRVDRTRFVIAMQSIMLVFAIAIAVLVAVHAPLWTLFAAQFVIGVANALNAPSFGASLPMLVDRVDVPGAVSLTSAMLNGSRILGPAIAAALVAVGLSVDQLFAVNAATYLFLIVPLCFVPLPRPSTSRHEVGWRRLLVGFRIVRSRASLSRSLGSMFLFSLLCLPYVGLFPSVARLNFGIESSSSSYRWLYIVWGLGAFFGALAVGGPLSLIGVKRLVPIGFASFGVALIAFGVVQHPTPAFPIAFVLGFMYFVTATSLSTVVQGNLHDDERGSVMPLWFMAFAGTVPLGNLVFGPVMDAVGAAPVLVLGGVAALGLAWWADLAHLPPDAFVDDFEPLASALDE